jgi:hypothetical protein
MDCRALGLCKNVSYVVGHKRQGHAIAQAVSFQLPIVTIQDQSQVRSCGLCGGQNGTGAYFLQVFRFPLLPLPILILPTAPPSDTA